MRLVNKLLAFFGLKLFFNQDPQISHIDIDDEQFWKFYDVIKEKTMVSIPNLFSLYNSVNYVVKNNIGGDFVECGVWRGGCSMLIALVLKHHNISNRRIYLYDTFDGMSSPTEFDKDFKEIKATDHLKTKKTKDRKSIWCYADLEDVTNNMKQTGYNFNNIVFIKGKVEETLVNEAQPEKISLLRLDTDWYESTKVELEHLFPKLEKEGVLVIDDYGHWQGARKAVNEYFSKNNINILLNRVDYTCRMGIKN